MVEPITARANGRALEAQPTMRARSRACANTGKRIAAKMAMIAIAPSSSIMVKPFQEGIVHIIAHLGGGSVVRRSGVRSAPHP